MILRLTLAPIVALILSAAPAQAEGPPRVGPVMAGASNFAQHVPRGMLDAVAALGVRDLRDGIHWHRVEGPDGRARWGAAEVRWPERMPDGMALSLLHFSGHPAWQGGAIPTEGPAVEAFGRHAARVVDRYPQVTSVEIGNEFNSDDFVHGPLAEGDMAARARGYAALLKSAARQVRAVRGDVRILGGGVHSIPTHYLRLLDAAGAFRWMDALAFHPYPTPLEILPAQVEAMRRIPALAAMPLEITEWGTTDAAAAPGALVRLHCAAALSGVTRIAWYPMFDRGDGFAAPLDRRGRPTPLARAFLLAQDRLAGRAVEDAAPDAFVRACLYGGETLVIWGLPRALAWGGDVQVVDALDRAVAGGGAILSETEPLVLHREGGLVAGRDWTLGPGTALADSLWQMGYPEGAGPDAGFRRLTRSPRGEAPLVTMEGQSRGGVPWTPYLGRPDDGDVRLLGEVLLPAGDADWPRAVVHRWRAPEGGATVDLALLFAPSASSSGIDVAVTVDGVPAFERRGTRGLETVLEGLAVPPGAALDVVAGPGADGAGDDTVFRLTLHRAAP